MSLPEVLLWQELRKRAYGHRFRRQHRIDPYVLDFYCAAVRLDVEVDSAWHEGGHDADDQRDQFLMSRGVCVLRIGAKDVLDSPEACAVWAANACDEVTRWREAGCPAGFRSREQVRYPPGMP